MREGVSATETGIDIEYEAIFVRHHDVAIDAADVAQTLAEYFPETIEARLGYADRPVGVARAHRQFATCERSHIVALQVVDHIHAAFLSVDALLNDEGMLGIRLIQLGEDSPTDQDFSPLVRQFQIMLAFDEFDA